MSTQRLAANPPPDDPAPLSPAPELVVEILSPSDSVTVLANKLADYVKVDVRECWVVHPVAKTVEVVALSEEGNDVVGSYTEGQTAVSAVFPGLQVAVSAIFAE
jgi:Uma2 family endonuclease